MGLKNIANKTHQISYSAGTCTVRLPLLGMVGTSIGIMRGGDGCGFGGGGVGGIGKPTSTQVCLFLRLRCPCLLVSIFLDYMFLIHVPTESIWCYGTNSLSDRVSVSNSLTVESYGCARWLERTFGPNPVKISWSKLINFTTPFFTKYSWYYWSTNLLLIPLL